MPRRAVVLQESVVDLSTPFSAVHSTPHNSREPAPGLVPAEVSSHASRVLTQAHRVLAQTDIQRRALQQGLAVLQTADPEAYFYYSLAPVTVTPAPGLHPGTRKARRLRPLLTTALHEVEARQEAIRLLALLTLSRLGVPVALWYFLIPGPLPLTVDALMPRAAPPPPLVSSTPQETTHRRSHPRGEPHTRTLP